MANNGGGGGGRNEITVKDAKPMLNQLKYEVAAELGVPGYELMDKGDLPARVHGKVGGNMVRKMIKYAERNMRDDNLQVQTIAMEPIPIKDAQIVAAYAAKNLTDLQ